MPALTQAVTSTAQVVFATDTEAVNGSMWKVGSEGIRVMGCYWEAPPQSPATAGGWKWVVIRRIAGTAATTYAQNTALTEFYPESPTTSSGGAHTHPESEVTNLPTDLSGKAASSHAHLESDVTSLTSDLAGKAISGHNHDASYAPTHTHPYEASGTVATHAAAGDPHAGYRLESADHTHASTGIQAGQVAYNDLTGKPSLLALGTSPSTQVFSDAAAGGSASDAAKTDHKHGMPANPVRSQSSTTPAAIGTGAVGTGSTDARADHVHATGAGTPSTQAFGDAAAVGTGPAASMTDHKHAMPVNPVTGHEAAVDPHTGYRLESADHSHASTGLQAGQIAYASITGTPSAERAAASTTPAAVGTAAVGTGSTDARADHVHATGAGTPSTQAFADAAATGTGPAAAMTDHKHAMPTLGFGLSGTSAPAVGLTTASAFATATTSISAATYADVTGPSVSLAAGTWLIVAQVFGAAANLAFLMHAAITDGANTIVSEGSQFVPASGTASVNAWGGIALHALVAPGSTTTYKLRAARGLTTLTNTWVAQDGSGLNVSNNASDNTDKGTGIFALRIA